MRVALVSPYDLDVPGGVQSHVRALARALVAAGDDVLVVGPGRPIGRADGEVRVGRSLGVPFNGSVAPVLVDPRGGARARAAIAAFAPDVVHVHEPLVPLLGPAVALASGPVLVTTNHTWSDRARLYRVARAAGRAVLRRAGAAIAVSAAAADYHAAALGVSPSRFTVVPNGVDVARFSCPRAPSDGRPPTVVLVGRLERRKGVIVLADAFARLRRDRPDVRLVVVGSGPEEQEFRRRAGDGLLLLGRVAQDALPAVLADADVVVAPSVAGESFGIVLLEAMAAGRPLIASDLPGYRSVVEEGDEAVLVPPGDVGALCSAIAGLLDDPGLRARLAERGRVRAAAFDWAIVAGRVREAYARALTSARRATDAPDDPLPA